MADTISFTLNGQPVNVEVDPDRMLLWVLRTELGLTGAKFGCGRGVCGACTVLVDNKPVRSCVYSMDKARGKQILTIEGLATNGKLHPVQEAFIGHDALQCGFCTPGMILGAYSLLMDNPKPTRDDVIKGMDGHLCRCAAYKRIVDAVETAAKLMQGGAQ